MAVPITSRNGALPKSALTYIEDGEYLRRDAGASYKRAMGDGMPRGCLRSGYRTKAQQKALYDDPDITAAPPGRSYHGEGTAADVDEPARSWLARNGRAYGWRRTIAVEPWHFEYDPDLDYRAQMTGDTMPAFADTPDISAAARDALNGNTPSWQTLLGYSGAGGFAAMRDLPAIKAALARLEAREVVPVDPAEVAAALAPMLEEAVVAELTGAGLLTADTAGPVMEAALKRVFAQLGDPE